VKVAKLERPEYPGAWFAEELEKLDGIVEEIKFSEVGDKYIITIIDMPKKELEALPEFGGW